MLALIAAALIAQSPAGPGGPIYSSGARIDSRPLFEFLPSREAGAPMFKPLCSVVQAGDKSGNWFCVDGAGVSADGGVQFLPIGTPTTQSLPLCPSRTTCKTESAQYLNGSNQKFESDAGLAPAADFTACWLGRVDVDKTTFLVSQDDSIDAGRGWEFGLASSAAYWKVWKDDSTGTALACAAGEPPIRTVNLICASYDYVADGTSVMKLYINGSTCTGGSSTAAVGPIQAITEQWMVGARGGSGASGAEYFEGATYGAFGTEKALSAADMTRLNTAVFGTLAGSKGETVTFARASTMTCDSEQGSVTVLPSGRPCVAGGGLFNERATTNLALRSEELDNVAWTAGGSGVDPPTVTANDGVAPDGSKTAEKIDFPEISTPSDYTTVIQSITASAAAHSATIWLKTASGTATIYLTLTPDNVTYQTATCAVTTTWTRCKLENKTLTAAAWELGVGVDLRNGAESGQSAQTVYAWGAQLEAKGYRTSYVRTEGSTVARASTNAYVDSVAMGNPQWSFAATIHRPDNVIGNARVMLIRISGADLWDTYIPSSDNYFIDNNSVTATKNGVLYDADSRMAGYYDGTKVYACVNGSCGVGQATAPFAGTGIYRVYLGEYSSDGSWELDGRIGKVCIDTKFRRCR